MTTMFKNSVVGAFNQSGQFRTVSAETPKIFRSNTSHSTGNTTETYLLIIFRDVSGRFGSEIYVLLWYMLKVCLL